MLKIGLTGGIGSGKTTVAHYFAALGVPVIDADQIARELVSSGQPALQAIVDAFGPTVLDSAGHLDRARLRAMVFGAEAHSGQRQLLESILHPLIRAEMQRRAQAMTAPYGLLSIPLLVEGGQVDQVARILVVDAPEAMQYQRVRQRDSALVASGILPLATLARPCAASEAEIAAILRAQASRQQRLAVADDIIVNDADLESLRQQVLNLHQFYQELAVAN